MEYNLITANEALLQSFEDTKDGMLAAVDSILDSFKPSKQLAEELGAKLGVIGIPSEGDIQGIAESLREEIKNTEPEVSYGKETNPVENAQQILDAQANILDPNKYYDFAYKFMFDFFNDNKKEFLLVFKSSFKPYKIEFPSNKISKIGSKIPHLRPWPPV